MERQRCPPFCEAECTIDHDNLLLAFINCSDEKGELSSESTAVLLEVIEEKQKEDDWSTQDPIDDPNPDYRYPPILWACAIGKPLLVKWLLCNGFQQTTQDMDSKDNGLHRSVLCLQKSQDTMKQAVRQFKQLVPLMSGCLLMKNSAGYTPFHMACEMFTQKAICTDFYRDCILLMFQYSLSKGQAFVSDLLNCQTESGETALHILARSEDNYKVLRTIMTQSKPDLYLKNTEGMTSLGVAISCGQMKNCRLLTHYLNETTDTNRKHTEKQAEGDQMAPVNKTIDITGDKIDSDTPSLGSVSPIADRLLNIDSSMCDMVKSDQLETRKSPRSAHKKKVECCKKLSHELESKEKTKLAENSISESTEVESDKNIQSSCETNYESKTESPLKACIKKIVCKPNKKAQDLKPKSAENKNSDSDRHKPRKALKRKLSDSKLTTGDTTEEHSVAKKMCSAKLDKAPHATRSSRKRCQTDNDKENSILENIGGDIMLGDKETDLLKLDDTNLKLDDTNLKLDDTDLKLDDTDLTENRGVSMELKRRKSENRLSKNRTSVVRRKSFKRDKVSPDSCPVLQLETNEVKEKRDINDDTSMPVLSPNTQTIFDKAKFMAKKTDTALRKSQETKSTSIWRRYIEVCEKKQPESIPVLLSLSTDQLQDVFDVRPELREKLGDHLECISFEERIAVPVQVQNLIATDPVEEKLKDLIAQEVKENEERERKIKKDVLELVSFENRMRSSSDTETSSPMKADLMKPLGNVDYGESDLENHHHNIDNSAGKSGSKKRETNADDEETDEAENTSHDTILITNDVKEVGDTEEGLVTDQEKRASDKEKIIQDSVDMLESEETAKENKDVSDTVSDSPVKAVCENVQNNIEPVTLDHEKTASGQEKITHNGANKDSVDVIETEEEAKEDNDASDTVSNSPVKAVCENVQNNIDSDVLDHENNASSEKKILPYNAGDMMETDKVSEKIVSGESISLEAVSELDQNTKSKQNENEVETTVVTGKDLTSGVLEHKDSENCDHDIIETPNDEVNSEMNENIHPSMEPKDGGDVVTKVKGEPVADDVVTKVKGEPVTPVKILPSVEPVADNVVTVLKQKTVNVSSNEDMKLDFPVIKDGQSLQVTEENQSPSVSPRRSESMSDGLAAYLTYSPSTRSLLKQSLSKDREECEQILQQKQGILNSITEEYKKLERHNLELEEEISSYMEHVSQLKAQLAMNNSLKQELQGQIQAEKKKLEQVAVKLQTCEKALEEL